MKRILLASASIVAFAGAAAAEVTFGGSASLGYNDVIEDGFFWETDLGVTLSQELNNGLTAAVTFGLNIDSGEEGNDDDFDTDDAITVDDNIVLSLTGESGGLFFGDTAYAAESHWDSAGTMASDGFSEQDEETVIRGDFTYMGIEASASYNVADAEGDSADDLDQLSLGAETTVGAFTVTMGYQQESDALFAGDDDDSDEGVYDHDGDDDFNAHEIFGISAGTTFGGADVQVAFATDRTADTNSIGFEASYPFGPVTLGAYYVIESDQEDSFGVSADYASGPVAVSAFYEFEDDLTDDDGDGDFGGEIGEDDDFGVEGSFDAGNGLVLYAGWIDSTEGYVGAEYDLGNGAEVIVSWAEQDEEGAREYKEGTTVKLSLEF